MLDLILRIIDTSAQVALVFISLAALFVWKIELRRKEKYQFTKELFNYVQGLKFIVHAQGSVHQIYINDLILNRENFFNNQLGLIGSDKLLFDRSILGLFHDLNLRSNIFIPKNLRPLIEEITPASLKVVRVPGERTSQTYLQLMGTQKDFNFGDENDLYSLSSDLSVRDYFRKWQSLIYEMSKNI